jgi:hypothetical protein
MKKNDSNDNEASYPILSILLENQEELVARADALRDSLIDDISDNSKPRLRQLEIISELLKPSFSKTNRRYQYALRQIKITELRELLTSTENLDNTQNVITLVKKVQKIGDEISFDINVKPETTDDKLLWSEMTEAKIQIKLNDIEDKQREILSKLDRKPSLDDALSALENSGLKAVPIMIVKAELQKNILRINDTKSIEFGSPSLQARLMGLFFTRQGSLNYKSFQFGDVFDKLEQHNPLVETLDGKQQLKKRYYEARRNINAKIKTETHIKTDFILYKNKAFSINKDILR